MRQRRGATLRQRNYSLADRNNQRKVWAAWLSQTKAARARRAASEMSGEAALPREWRRLHRYQIAGSAVRTPSVTRVSFCEANGRPSRWRSRRWIGRTESRTLAHPLCIRVVTCTERFDLLFFAALGAGIAAAKRVTSRPTGRAWRQAVGQAWLGSRRRTTNYRARCREVWK